MSDAEVTTDGRSPVDGEVGELSPAFLAAQLDITEPVAEELYRELLAQAEIERAQQTAGVRVKTAAVRLLEAHEADLQPVRHDNGNQAEVLVLSGLSCQFVISRPTESPAPTITVDGGPYRSNPLVQQELLMGVQVERLRNSGSRDHFRDSQSDTANIEPDGRVRWASSIVPHETPQTQLQKAFARAGNHFRGVKASRKADSLTAHRLREMADELETIAY